MSIHIVMMTNYYTIVFIFINLKLGPTKPGHLKVWILR